MDSKRLTLLAAAAVAAIGVAAALVLKRAPEAEGSLLAGPVLPGLAEKLNDVASLRFVEAGDKTLLTLQRGADGWVVAERDGYPADAGKVRTALLNLGETKVVETKTANPERYTQLGVEDVDAAGAKGLRAELSGEGVDYKLIVGNYAGQQGEGTYVRRVGEASSLMAAGNLVPDRNPGAWLRKELTDIASDRIREIELVKGEDRPLRLYKDGAGDANFKVADVPRGRELQSDVVANGLGSMLSGLTLEDVAKDSADAHGDRPLHRASYRMFDGLVVTLDGWQEADSAEGNPGKAYARLRASLDEGRANEKIAADIAQEQAAAKADAEAAAAQAAAATAATESGASAATGSDAKPAEAAAAAPSVTPPAPAPIDVPARTAERLAALKKEVDDLNARVQGWRFQIPAFKFANVNKTMDDLLKAAGE